MVSKCIGDIVSRKHLLVNNNFDGMLFHSIYIEMMQNQNGCVMEEHEKLTVENFFQRVTSNGVKIKIEN